MSTSTLLSNTRPLDLDPTGAVEVVRHYEVLIHKPGLVDDDGVTEIAYTVEITLRYPPERADARPAGSWQARHEAATRATKLERRTHHTPDVQALFVDPDVDVTFVRESLRPARAA